MGDFSVVLLRPNFTLVSEEYPMKAHKNQWLLNPLPPPDVPWEPRTNAYTLAPEVQTPSQSPDMGRPSAIRACNFLRTKRFHGISSAGPHTYSLK
jgi:hypothetical protein